AAPTPPAGAGSSVGDGAGTCGAGAAAPPAAGASTAGSTADGPPTTAPASRALRAASPARVAASSLKWLPTCPRTQRSRAGPVRPEISASIARMSSTFFTGEPEAVFHPLRFQPGSHSVAHLIAYWESDSIISGSW